MTVFKSCSTPRCRNRKGLDIEGKCPKCVELKKKRENDPSVPIYPCGRCNEECTELQRAVMCDYCTKWHHCVCIDMSEATYDVIFKTQSLRWFCDHCDVKIEEVIEKSVMLEKQTRTLEEKMCKVESRLETVESKLTGAVHKEIHSAINERADIDRRKMNLVIYNLKEAENVGDEQSAWDSVKRIEEDSKHICTIIENELKVNMGITTTPKITNAIRLGKRSGDPNNKKCRPLKITFDDIKTKREVLTRSKELRNSENAYVQKIFVNPDLTPEQRKKEQALREKMWELRVTENKNVYIQKGQIVEAPFVVNKIRPARPQKPSTSTSMKEKSNTTAIKDSASGNTSTSITEKSNTTAIKDPASGNTSNHA